MPRVPTVQESRVQLRGLSTRGVGTRSRPEDFGSDLGQSLQQVGGQIAQIEQDRARRERDTLVQEYGTAASQFDTDRILGEALQTKGKDAFGVEDVYLPEFDRWHGEFIKDRPVEQRELLDTLAARRRQQIQRQLVQHRLQQEEVYQADTARAYQEQNMLEIQAYWTDSERVEQALTNTENSIRASAEGRDQAAVDLDVAKARSKARYTVISQMVVANRPVEQIREYMEQHQSELADGGDLANAQKIFEDYSATSAAQDSTDAIMLEHDNLTDALAAARQIDDAEQRDAVVTRVRQRFAEQDAAKERLQREAYEGAQQAVEETGDMSRISPEMRLQLSSSQLNALETRARQVRDMQINGQEPVTNRESFSRWLVEATQDPTAFAQRDPYETFRQHTNDSDFRALVSLQDSIKNGSSDNLDTTMTVSFNDRLLTGARRAGFVPGDGKPADWNDTEIARFNNFRDAVSLEIEARERAIDRKLTTNEQQEVISDIMARTVMVDDWGSDSSYPAAALLADDMGAAYVPMAQIDDRTLAFIKADLEPFGLADDSDLIQRLAAAAAVRDQALYEQIIEDAQ